MRVTLVNHASAIIEAGDVVLWTDPWLFGRAFNESWALQPQPPLEEMEAWLPRITHLFVSHEHPDHFHIPTLRWLPTEFKKRVPVLFQELHSTKMPDAFKRLGFSNVRTFRHREIAEISRGIRFYMFQEAPLDSACALIDDAGRVVLNLNDCEPSARDRAWLRKDLGGSVDVLLNQFSIATYDGRENVAEVAPRQASRLLERMVTDHIEIGARVTIPVASFMYFCCVDNAYLNPYRNTIEGTRQVFAQAGLDLVVLRPFDTYEPGTLHDNTAALSYYSRLDRAPLAADPAKSVTGDEVEAAAMSFFDDLYAHYPTIVLRQVGAFRVWIPDLRLGYVFDIRARTMIRDPRAIEGWDIQINSQPLWFALSQPYGFQTLTISGRFVIRRGERRFLLLRVIAGLRNAEIFLKPRHMLSVPFLTFVARNFVALTTQAFSTLRMITRFVD